MVMVLSAVTLTQVAENEAVPPWLEVQFTLTLVGTVQAASEEARGAL